MELQEALAQVSEIRLQIARSESFRGYRSVTAAFSALTAVVAAALQPLFVPAPLGDPHAYLLLWITAAVVGAGATGIEMAIRCRRSASPTASRTTWMAVEQFVPCLLAGAVLTFVMAIYLAEELWMLPGLWGVLFSLGIFASRRLLPRAVIWLAFYYLACGALALALAQETWAFSPWAMGITFGGGQALTAIVLYVTLERDHGGS